MIRGNVLVTGSAGFVGSALRDDLINTIHSLSKSYDQRIIGVDKCPARYPDEYQDDITTDECRERLTAIPLLSTIYHLAAEARIQPSFKRPIDYVKANVLGTANMLEVARRTKARFIYVGSSTADWKLDANMYALTKGIGEDLTRYYRDVHGVDAYVCRLYNVYGGNMPGHGERAVVLGIWREQLRRGERITVTGNGLQRRDFVHVDDVCDALYALGSKPLSSLDKHVYSIGGGLPMPIAALAAIMGEVTDMGIDTINRPPGEADATRADVEDTWLRLGWKPKIKVEEWLAEKAKEWWEERPK